uniref:Uncharacterized protein n=1 Tax=viral metagenome TaxID=1070528 RepID=A0A6C0AEE2_9ZZZZ
MEKFNNIKWVNEKKLFLDKNNPNLTFSFVQKNHPNYGCVLLSFDDENLSKSENLKDLSTYADAVIVCCHEVIGNSHFIKNNFTDELIINANITCIGGISYIALNHSDEKVRDFHFNLIERWRKL